MFKHKIFYRILWADLLIVLILVGMMIPLCYQMITTIRERELNDSYNSMLNCIDILDSQIKSLENILTKAYVNENLVRVSIIDGEMQTSDYYALLKAQQHIAAIASSNSYVADIIVVFKSNDIILSKYTSFNSTNALNKYYHIDGMENIIFSKETKPISEHMSMLDQSFNYLPETTITYLSSEPNNSRAPLEVFCYRLPLGLPMYTKENGVAYIFINKKYVLDTALPQNFKENGFFQLLDNQGNIILAYGNNLISSDYKGVKHYNQSIDGSSYSIINVNNHTNTLRIVAGIPQKTFMSGMRNIFLLISFYIALAILLGVFISLWIAYSQSAPLKKLLHKLELQGFIREEGYRNEYDFISTSLARMKSENKNILKQLDAFRSTLKSNMIERLLSSGQLTPMQQNDILTHPDDFPASFIIGYGEFQSQMQLNKQDSDVLKVLAIDHLKKVFPSNTIYHSLGENAFALIIPGDEQSKIADTLTKAIQQINIDIPTKIILAISTSYIGISNVNAAFEQARLVYALGDKNNYLLTPSDIIYSSNSTLDVKDYLELYRYLITADFAAVEQYIRQMFDFATNIPNTDMEQLYYIIRMTLLFAARDYIGVEKASPDIPKYQSNQSPEQMIETLCNISRDICNIVDSNKRSHNAELKDSILEYIKQSFKDSNVYGKQIAEHFSISEKYLYNFIKEQTGYSLGDYLQYLRLEHAVTLLIDSEKSIANIYNECGYITHNTFYKAFKRVYGISPSEYRDRFTRKEELRITHH